MTAAAPLTWERAVARIDDLAEYSIPQAAALIGVKRSTFYRRVYVLHEECVRRYGPAKGLLVSIGKQVRIRGRVLRHLAHMVVDQDIAIARQLEDHEARILALEERANDVGSGAWRARG